MRGMKTSYVFLAILCLLVFASVSQAAGIADTKHNLSSTGTGSINTSGTTEICVFCHTPHGSDTAVAAPLWNRAVTTSTYTMYNSPSIDGTIDAQPTGVSQACLSCHDGTIAFDALRNLPGSGGFSNAPSAAGVTSWIFANAGDKKMPGDRVANLGMDLTNDHPISIDYASAASPSSSSGVNSHATGFKDPTGTISSTGDTYFSNGLKLVAGKVQCNSCHDPHRSDNATFLRIDSTGGGSGGVGGNNGSAVCLTCHQKDA